jgi:xylulokinase/erythritol kinase
MFSLFGLDGFRHLFPPVVPAEHIAGAITGDAAAATGLRAGTPVIAGAGDVPASAIGLGAVEAGVACTLLGTNILNCLVTDEAIFAPAGVGLLFCLPGDRWLRAMVNISGTTSLDWFAEQFCAAERQGAASPADLFTRLESLARSSTAGANGVLYLPYLSPLGITTPFLEPAARAEFFGLTDQHTRGDMLRAVYEGIALSIRDGYAVLPQAVSEIRLSGGGAKSLFWSQLIADCTGKTVIVPEGTEFGAKGAALLAGVALGWYRSIGDAVAATAGPARRHVPDLANTERYDRLYRVYRLLQQDLRPAWQEAAGRREL